MTDQERIKALKASMEDLLSWAIWAYGSSGSEVCGDEELAQDIKTAEALLAEKD